MNLLKKFLNLYKNNHFINVYPQKDTYIDVNSGSDVGGICLDISLPIFNHMPNYSGPYMKHDYKDSKIPMPIGKSMPSESSFGSLTLKVEPINSHQLVIYDFDDTQYNLAYIMPKDLKSKPKTFEKHLKNKCPFLFNRMKNLYHVNTSQKGFYVLINQKDMKVDKYGNAQISRRIADLVHFIEDTYLVNDLKRYKNK